MMPPDHQGPQRPWPPQAEQQSKAVTRALAFARTMTTQAASLVVITGFLQLVMPAGYTPGDMLGKFHGGIEKAETSTKADAVVSLAERTATAQATPPAIVAMETEAFRVQQQKLAESLETQSTIANLADWACLFGAFVPPNDPNWKDVGEGLRSGCGVGDNVRDNMINKLANGGRAGSTLIQRPTPAAPAK